MRFLAALQRKYGARFGSRLLRDLTVPRNDRCLSSSVSTGMPGAEVRRRFLDFFASRNHTIVPSSSVVPKNDTSLLFVNAGMNQFKDILLGKEDSAHARVANSQKCIRAGGKHNDLDDVGHDGRHHTFFEMLGNWSFGDYFQQDACSLAYELLTQVYKLPKEALLITYFGGDPEVGLGPDFECREIWRAIGVPEAQIIPLGSKDNFWAMGEEGPCGPCTEIHYSPTGRQENMLELWNLVFMQFNRLPSGSLEPLRTKNVDTGMGLERMVAVLQGKTTNYETDLFFPVLSHIRQLTNAPAYQSKFGEDDYQGLNTAYRIVADHVRMLTVAIADGMLPGPKKAPFVLRKVIRRAAFTWKDKFNADPAQMPQLVHTVSAVLGEAHPEIASGEAKVKKVLLEEIADFEFVLAKGTKAFSEVCKRLENKMILPAEEMFFLYVRQGVPEELLLNLAKSRNMRYDITGFYALLEAEREKSRADLRQKRTQGS